MTKGKDNNLEIEGPDGGLQVIEAEVIEVETDLEDPAIEVDGGDDGDGLETTIEVESTSRALAKPRRAGLPEQLTVLNVYLAKMKDAHILPIEEQTELAVRYQETGDKEAATRLVTSNLRLVVKIAFQFRRQWADVMDLIAEGNVGLAEAIRKFDADKGVPFPSYARYWIRARILAFIQEHKHLVHTGTRAARKLFWRLEKERQALISEGFDPTPKRIASRVGVAESDVLELAPILDHRHSSLDVPAFDDDGASRGDRFSDSRVSDPEDVASDSQIQDILKGAFERFRATLNEREQAIWDERLQAMHPLRLEDLGNRFGVSKERIRQIEVRVKARLKDFLEEELGEDVIIEALH
jgi:RNA polymerase sigma-32 factor